MRLASRLDHIEPFYVMECAKAAGEIARGLVQHAVDVLVAVGTAEFLGQFHRLVDGHLVGDLQAVLELPGSNQQGRMLNGGQCLGTPIGMARQHGIQGGCVTDTAMQQGIKVLLIASLKAYLLPYMSIDHASIRARQQPLVQALQGGFA